MQSNKQHRNALESPIHVDRDTLTYDQARSILTAYEQDLERLVNRTTPAIERWLSDGKNQLQELPEKFDSIKDKAPDSWGEMKDGFAAALVELSEGYRRAIKEIQD